MTAMDMIKQLSDTVLEKFRELAEKQKTQDDKILTLTIKLSDEFKKEIEDLKKSIPEPYNDSEIQNRLSEIQKSIPDPYNDSEIKEKLSELAKKTDIEIPDPYNDAEIKKKISDIESKMVTEVPDQYNDAEIIKRLESIEESMPTDIPDPYNDSDLREKIAELEVNAITELPDPYNDSDIISKIDEVEKRIPEPYSDEDIKEQIKSLEDGIEKFINKKLVGFEERVEKTFKEVSKKVTYDMPAPIEYSSDQSIKKGAFILWKNALWFNKMDDNNTEPSNENKSYMLLIPAPKEPTHKGLYKEGVKYDHTDIVMKDNSSWFRVKGGTDDLPGSGWKLLAKGMKGRKGEKGESVKVEFSAEKTLEELNDRLMILEAKNVDND